MNSIAKLVELVKRYESDIILAIGAALISLLSFAAGYLTAEGQLKEPILIEKSEARYPTHLSDGQEPETISNE